MAMAGANEGYNPDDFKWTEWLISQGFRPDLRSNKTGLEQYMANLANNGLTEADFTKALQSQGLQYAPGPADEWNNGGYFGRDPNAGFWNEQAVLRTLGRGLETTNPGAAGVSDWNKFWNQGTETAQQNDVANAWQQGAGNDGDDLDDLGSILTGLGLVAGVGGLAGAFGGGGLFGGGNFPVGGADWMSEIAAGAGNGGSTLGSYVPTVASDAASTWSVGNPGTTGEGLTNIITGETGPTVTGGGSAPMAGEGATGVDLNSAINQGLGQSGYPSYVDPYTGTGGIAASGGAAASSSSGFTDFIKNLFSPTSGGGGGLSTNSPAGSILGALGNYLSGSQTADSYKSLQEALLKAGDVSQRPGAQWALGRAQNYINDGGMGKYVNDMAQPIMNSYAQRIPGAVAKSGDLTGAMNKSMTDMGAAISGNYNGFINSLLGATGTTQPNAGIASAGQAGASGINQQQAGTGALYGTIGNAIGNAANNLFNTPTASGTTYVG